jgi:hypothetical protein
LTYAWLRTFGKIIAGSTALCCADVDAGVPPRTWEIYGQAVSALTDGQRTNKFTLKLCETGAWNLVVISSVDGFHRPTEEGCDGTNIYVLARGASGATLIDRKPNQYGDSGVIYPDVVKHFSPSIAGIWWLFCSPYVFGFRAETNCGDFAGLVSPDASRKVFCRNIVRTGDDRIGLDGGQIFVVAPTNLNAKPNVVLSVESAETNGVSYPVSATLVWSRPTRPIISIRTDSVRPIDSPASFLPTVDSVASITDKRVRGSRGEYVGTNWLSSKAIFDLALEKRATWTTVLGGVPKVPSRNGEWWLMAFFATGSVPVIYILCRQTKGVRVRVGPGVQQNKNEIS